MTPRYEQLASRVAACLGPRLIAVGSGCGELTYEVARDDLLEVARILRDDPELRFEMLIDLCAVDYLAFGRSEWETTEASGSGFGRAAMREQIVPAADESYDQRRFAVVYHLLSISGNYRLRLRVFTGAANPPVVPSVIPIWQAADWYEREAFDLFGVLFEGHPDLRRILTDYGFIGHPFRKDFPISGNLEVRYDPEKNRVIYQPVSIEPRVLVPRVIREENPHGAGSGGG
ncbi:MAG: NADH-quinone oxidoreductase subunit C [Gammaproteobacteria bacterium]|nr:MAG: NADH-quinone oxidoreductase subunit C [Gammaproteobacteria bacterium]